MSNKLICYRKRGYIPEIKMRIPKKKEMFFDYFYDDCDEGVQVDGEKIFVKDYFDSMISEDEKKDLKTIHKDI
jgi:hypothetical protein